MNIKLTPLFSAVALALVATTSSSFAKVYTAATFKKELTAQLAKKTNGAAITTASGFLKKALTDPKNKKLVTTFTTATVAALKKKITTSFQVTSATKLVDAVANGYFTKLTYNGTNAAYLKSITAAAKSLTVKSLKTVANANKINAPLAKFNTKKKGTAATALKIKQTVYTTLGLPKPIS